MYDVIFIPLIFMIILFQKQVYDRQDPFGSDLLLQIIESHWLSTKGRGSYSDHSATVQMFKNKSIPLSVVFLVLSVVRISDIYKFKLFILIQIELAIRDWSSGRHAKGNFSEDLCKRLFIFHS